MGKRVRFDDDARSALWRGIDQLASAVRITLGPRGRSVVLDHAHGASPTITRDGIAVAQELELPDPFENMGVQMLRDVAVRTGQEAGDGTSTATVLAHRIVGDGLAAVQAGGNPVAIRRGIDASVTAALAALAALARPLEDERDVARIASLVAADEELGVLIAQAIRVAGPAGVVSVEDGPGMGVTLEVVDGLRFNAGYASPYFVTDAAGMDVSLDHPLVLVADGAIVRPNDIVPAMELAAQQQRPLLCVCAEIGTEALAVMVVNRLRGTVPGVAVQVGLPSAARRELLEDLALATGAQLLGPGSGLATSAVRIEQLGRAQRVTAARDHTTVLRGGGRLEAIRARRTELERALRDAPAGARDTLRERLARLAGAIAVLRVGAATDVEREARRSQVEDALGATRAAAEEGIVPGGGVALLHAAAGLESLKLRASERVGRDIVAAALAQPAWQIAVNSGAAGDAVLERLRSGGNWFGYDALTGEFGELDRAGIVDPAKVARCALQQAGGLGGLVLTTDVLVVEDGEGGEEKAE